ncbi:MAG: asparagine synthetase B, partial [Bacteroidia bacterium]|nr:asparagine synthetase B [Bacteroidia bacterium]
MSKRRGPDHTDVQSGTFYKLGFNRLSILDLSEKGNQPIYSPCERYHVVYNGEVYNFKELSQEFNLQDLRSTSDTEVIVQLFDKIGIVET